MDLDELKHALGSVVLEAAYLERVLRMAFSALIGSKYAAVVDARLTVVTMVEDCERLARHHTEIARPDRDRLVEALKSCRDANSARNRVIHDAGATRPGNVRVTMPGGPSPHEVTVAVRTAAEVQRVAGRLAEAAEQVRAAMTATLGSDWVVVEDQLRHELGRDVGDDNDA
jgi:hypothetical protein